MAWAYLNVLCSTSTTQSQDQILSSPAISLDDTKVAWVTSDGIVQILTIGTTGSNGSISSAECVENAPGGTGTSPNNAVLNSLILGNAKHHPTSGVTLSQIFVDYISNSAYIGDDDGFLQDHTVLHCHSRASRADHSFVAGVSGLRRGQPDRRQQRVHSGMYYCGHIRLRWATGLEQHLGWLPRLLILPAIPCSVSIFCRGFSNKVCNLERRNATFAGQEIANSLYSSLLAGNSPHAGKLQECYAGDGEP